MSRAHHAPHLSPKRKSGRLTSRDDTRRFVPLISGSRQRGPSLAGTSIEPHPPGQREHRHDGADEAEHADDHATRCAGRP